MSRLYMERIKPIDLERKVIVSIDKKKLQIVFLAISAGLLLLSLFCIHEGIDKKEHYYNSDYSSLSVNAYVGGDAYNYIINAGYFAGYFALAGGCLTSSAILFCTGMVLSVKETERTMPSKFQNVPQMPLGGSNIPG